MEMVKHGVTTRSDMKRHLWSLVIDRFPEAQENDAAYYPSSDVISAHMWSAKMRCRWDKFDERNVIYLVEDWRKKYPQDFTFYRPRTAGAASETEPVARVDENDEDDMFYYLPTLDRSKTSLLFIHQSAAQLRLLKRYHHMVLMDATYRVCRLAIPLYIMAVKTNIAYMPVAIFIVESEDAASIQEVLTILKEHWDKHDIEIQNWMVDCSPTEIFALQNVFLDSRVFMCDFHRIQAWNRWLKTRTNGSSAHHIEIISILKRIGAAATLEKFREAEEELKSNAHFQKAPRLRKYYGRWRDVKEVSAHLGL